MARKKRKITASVYMSVGGTLRKISGRKKIILLGKNKGVLLDGRVVVKKNGRWIYYPR